MAEAFQKLGVKPFFVGSRFAAADAMAQFEFDALVLDHESGGLDETAALLESLPDAQVPSFVLRDCASEAEQIKLLHAGASEVLPRAGSKQLLALKIIKAAQAPKGRQAERQMRLIVGALRLDALALTGTVHGKQLALTPRQFDLLFLLAMRAGKLVHRSELERVLGIDARDSKRALDMQLCRIRKCLRDAGDHSISVRSVYGYGYCLSAEQERDQMDLLHSRARSLPPAKLTKESAGA